MAPRAVCAGPERTATRVDGVIYLGRCGPLNVQSEQALREIERAKQEVRNRIWALLERDGAAKPPGTVVGKIPNFLGAEAAAEQLAALPAWQTAQVVKANPDKAQRAVRAKALVEGKVLYVAVPRLADELPFYLLEPERLTIPRWEAASKEGAARVGRKVAASELRPGDLEVAFLVEAGVLGPDTVLATTVHPLQVVDEPLPETVHDFRVDLIATPDAVIWCGQPRRPPGILWEHLHRDKIAAIPVLEALAAQR